MGLGDAVEKALSLTGLTKDRVEAWLGRPCNCAARQEKLNRLGQWAARVLGQAVGAGGGRGAGGMVAVEPLNKTIPASGTVRWACGVTTVPARRDTYLPGTLESLRLAGFGGLRLFVDGLEHREADAWEGRFKMPVTPRWPALRTHGAWVLALYELYLRDASADFFAVFQDDFLACRDLRRYLEANPWPERGYANLLTFPENQALFPMQGQTGRQKIGWWPSNQRGKGAVALAFRRDAAMAVLASPHMVERPLDPERGWKFVDGGIVSGMAKAGFREFVHNPSLVQHVGKVSSIGNRGYSQLEAPSFRGEDFSALRLLGEVDR